MMTHKQLMHLVTLAVVAALTAPAVIWIVSSLQALQTLTQ